MTPIQSKALVIATSMLNVREEPLGSNRGLEIDEFVRSVGLDPAGHYPWCAAFVFYCHQKAAEALNAHNPCPRTGSALGLWLKSPEARTKTPTPGAIFVMDFGHGTGHVGFVEEVNGEMLTTIEGNTNVAGEREGIGVFRRLRRPASTIGFLDFGKG